MAIAYALVWMPPSAAPEVLFAWLIVASILVRVSVSLFEVPSAALMAELTSDYDERTSLSVWRSLFMAIGLVGMGIAVFKVFLLPTAEQPVGQLNAAGYSRYGVVAAVIMLIAILVATWGTRDRIPFLNMAMPPVRHDSMLSGIRLLLQDRAYVSVVTCVFFFAVAGGLATTLGTYMGTYFWKLSADQLGALAGAIGIGVILGLLASNLAGALGKKTVTIGAYAVALVAAVLLTSLRLLGIVELPVERLLPWLMLQQAVVSMCIILALVMAGTMLADVADHVEARTGRRMEGLMFAALIMVQKAVSGVGVFLSGMILTLIEFPQKADPATIDPAVVHQLGTIYIVGVGTVVVLALVAVSFYPITRDVHHRNQEVLARMRAAPIAR
jgi:Na+/melibiose symporter-like transporter